MASSSSSSLLSSLRRLLSCVVVFVASVVASDMFTSMNDIQQGLLAQRTLANDLRAYIHRETDRIAALSSIAAELEQHSTDALENTDYYLANPVNAYLLIKKFSVDWNENVKRYINTATTEEFLEYLQSTWGSVLPNRDDLYGSALALLRLQDVYALTATKIAHGIVENAPKSPTMTAGDCFQLGTIAYYRNDHYHAILWLTEALKVEQTETEKTVSRAEILDFLSFSMYKQGNPLHAYNLTLEWLQLDPGHERAQNNLRNYEELIRDNEVLLEQLSSKADVQVQNKRLRDEYKATEDFDNYERLCRGEKTHENPNAHLLTCQYRRHHPIFYLNPLREEILRLNPLIVLYHEIATDAEIAKVKEVATPKLHRSGVFQLTENDNPFTDYRTSKSAWLNSEEDPEGLLESLNQKASALSNLTLYTAEQLQVLNYGIGGQYEPHHDFARPTEIQTFEEWRGNRIATVIYYLTDVEAGGGTAFNAIGVHTPAKKGSCVLWYNLLKNGDGDYDTKHAGCPVLIGNKWVVTKWFHAVGNEFSRPCGLSPDE